MQNSRGEGATLVGLGKGKGEGVGRRIFVKPEPIQRAQSYCWRWNAPPCSRRVE
jgi:hypothetical protein